MDWVGLNLSRLKQYIEYGKLSTTETINMKVCTIPQLEVVPLLKI